MKIIGKTTHGCILEAEDSECKKLIGYKYKNIDMKIGMEINIHAMFDSLYYLKNDESKLKKIAKELREYASLLEIIDPIKVLQSDESK